MKLIMQLRISVLAALLLLVSTCLAEAQTKEVLLSEVPEGLEVATVAGGCFWCTEAVFERVKGVADVFSGYSGGAEEGPTYRKVSNGMSTHAEAIQIYFDPRVLNFDKLLEIFFYCGA